MFALSDASEIYIGGKEVSKIEIGGKIAWESKIVLYDGVTKTAADWNGGGVDDGGKLTRSISPTSVSGEYYQTLWTNADRIRQGKKLHINISTYYYRTSGSRVKLYICTASYNGGDPDAYKACEPITVPNGDNEWTIPALTTSSGYKFVVSQYAYFAGGQSLSSMSLSMSDIYFK